MNKIFNKNALISFIFITFVLSTIFVTIAFIMAPTVVTDDNPFERVKGDYVLMLLQCIVGIFAMLLPGILRKRIRLEIPSNMLIIYAVFLYCAIYLGEVRAFYYNVSHWDTILHTFSGAMLGALGFSFINFLNKAEQVHLSLSPLFVAVFTLCFAVTLGVVWEIYEFSMDYLLSTNMQKFALEDGTQLIGSAALADTMKDLIVDTMGALVMAVIGFISLRYRMGWLEKLQLTLNNR